MHINLEATDKHSVQAYTEKEIKVNSLIYTHSLIISKQEVISNWPISSIRELNEDTLKPLLHSHPKIIIIGHQQIGQFAPELIRLDLGKHRIGFETMSIGAACRTFNVLLGEQREVVIGLIL